MPFGVQIAEDERDKDLAEKLREASPAILRWAVDGCLAWLRDGLCPPDAVRAATEAYRAESDQVGRFLAECCEVDPLGTVQGGVLHAAFRRWGGTMSASAFGRELGRRGYGTVRSGTVKRVGLRLRDDTSDTSDTSDRFSESFHI